MSETMRKAAVALVPTIEINSWDTDSHILGKLLGTGVFQAAYAEVVCLVSQSKGGPLRELWAEASLDYAESSDCARSAIAMMALSIALSRREAVEMLADAEPRAAEAEDDGQQLEASEIA